MEMDSQKRVAKHLFLALRPIARLLLAAGINYQQFSNAAKRAFVDIATSDYGVRSRPANTSRVAIITGLTRKEVKRLRDQVGDAAKVADQPSTIPADVLHFWHTDHAYVLPNGDPLQIAYAGSDISFANLVRRTGADVSPAAVLAELQRMGAVEELPNGLLQAKQRYYVPLDLEELVVGVLRFGLYTISGTAAFNAVATRDGGAARRFQRFVESAAIPEARVTDVKAFLEGELKKVSEELDDALASYASTEYAEPHPGAPKRRVGVGLYYFEDD